MAIWKGSLSLSCVVLLVLIHKSTGFLLSPAIPPLNTRALDAPLKPSAAQLLRVKAAGPDGRVQRLRLSMSGAPGGDSKKKQEASEGFEVTWEHEDGTKDVMRAVPIETKKGEPIKGQVAAPQGFFGQTKAALKKFFLGSDGDKSKLASLGASALLSYGWVSNISYVTCTIIAWVIHGKRTGTTPLDPGQWPAFLAVYAGFYVIQNVIRPVRFAVSVAISPFFEKMVTFFQTKSSALMKRDVPRAAAFGITVFLVNVVGTFTYLFGGLFLATTFAGVPLIPSRFKVL